MKGATASPAVTPSATASPAAMPSATTSPTVTPSAALQNLFFKQQVKTKGITQFVNGRFSRIS